MHFLRLIIIVIGILNISNISKADNFLGNCNIGNEGQYLNTALKIVDEFNTAAIYITHDLAVVAQLADRIKVLRDGEEIEESETSKMLTNPKENYTKSLWAVRSLSKPEIKSKDIILSIKNIDASYGKVKVLSNISIEIPKGRTVAIVGESGSGKSTLAKVLTGLLAKQNGSIIYNNKPLENKLRERSRENLKKIQIYGVILLKLR